MSGYRRGLGVTLIFYAAVYGALLVHTRGFPYVCDNNETFSSLWHAHNLYHFSLRDSCGITDEASSPHAEAHPYVHTHQGNFPRLFAFLLYALGVRSAVAQIVVTTFTVGLAAILLAFHVLARRVNPLFAAVAVAFLM